MTRAHGPPPRGIPSSCACAGPGESRGRGVGEDVRPPWPRGHPRRVKWCMLRRVLRAPQLDLPSRSRRPRAPHSAADGARAPGRYGSRRARGRRRVPARGRRPSCSHPNARAGRVRLPEVIERPFSVIASFGLVLVCGAMAALAETGNVFQPDRGSSSPDTKVAAACASSGGESAFNAGLIIVLAVAIIGIVAGRISGSRRKPRSSPSTGASRSSRSSASGASRART